jgi:hypothetical protein
LPEDENCTHDPFCLLISAAAPKPKEEKKEEVKDEKPKSFAAALSSKPSSAPSATVKPKPAPAATSANAPAAAPAAPAAQASTYVFFTKLPHISFSPQVGSVSLRYQCAYILSFVIL